MRIREINLNEQTDVFKLRFELKDDKGLADKGVVEFVIKLAEKKASRWASYSISAKEWAVKTSRIALHKPQSIVKVGQIRSICYELVGDQFVVENVVKQGAWNDETTVKYYELMY